MNPLLLLLVWLDLFLEYYFSPHFSVPYCFVWSFHLHPPPPPQRLPFGREAVCCWLTVSQKGRRTKSRGIGAFPRPFTLQSPGSPLLYVRVKEFQI